MVEDRVTRSAGRTVRNHGFNVIPMTEEEAKANPLDEAGVPLSKLCSNPAHPFFSKIIFSKNLALSSQSPVQTFNRTHAP
jgi:hypothetical protein